MYLTGTGERALLHHQMIFFLLLGDIRQITHARYAQEGRQIIDASLTFDDLIIEFADELVGGHLIFGCNARKNIPTQIFLTYSGDDTTNPHGTRALLVVNGISAGVDIAHGFPQKNQRTHQGIR